MITRVEQSEIIEFITLTNLSNFPDNDTSMDEFLSATYRFYDIIKAYDACPKKAANAYNTAKEKALTIIKERMRYQDANMPRDDRLNLAKQIFADTMNKEFYQTYIRYKWMQVRAYNKQTSVLSRNLYHDYLASLDVHQFVDYSHLPSL